MRPLTTTADVMNLLDVEVVSAGRFRGKRADDGSLRVFGGQVVAQALASACRTVTDDRLPHSLHAYFLRAGDASEPIDFDVEVLRDGRTFSVRHIVGRQNGAAVFTATASFAVDIGGVDYQDSQPTDFPEPVLLQSLSTVLAPYAEEHDGWWVRDRPFEMRYIAAPPRMAVDRPDGRSPHSALWVRARGEIGSDPALARCLLAYVSDLTLLDSATKMTGQTSRGPGVVASLDHSLWFHRTPDFSDWLLYDQRSPTGANGRALVRGVLYSSTGEMLCTAVQEGYLDPSRQQVAR